MTTDLRTYDPAPAAIDPHSSEADTMLTDILSTPRVAPNHRRRVVGLGLATAAAAAVVAVPAFWPGDHAPSSAQAFSVTKHDDGSVQVRIDEDDFNDAAGLERALADVGVTAHVRVHQYPADYEGDVWDDWQQVPEPTAGCTTAPYLFLQGNGKDGTRGAYIDGSAGTSPVGTTASGPELMTLYPDRLPKGGEYLLDAFRVGDHVAVFGPNYEICGD